MIAFCGQVPVSDLGKDSFQEANVMGLARACTKWCVQPQTVEALPRRIDDAFDHAMSVSGKNRELVLKTRPLIPVLLHLL